VDGVVASVGVPDGEAGRRGALVSLEEKRKEDGNGDRMDFGYRRTKWTTQPRNVLIRRDRQLAQASWFGLSRPPAICVGRR
jgi:hypothetical protein